jgi:hypothetical protein
MEEADIWYAVDDHLAIQLKQQPKHTMRAGVLRTHIQQNGLAF